MSYAPVTDHAVLAALRALGERLAQAGSTARALDAALDVLSELLPGRTLAARALDVRTRDNAIVAARGAALRPHLETEGVTLDGAKVGQVGLKAAMLASARLAVRPRWDSPFVGVATGFVAPLAVAGELLGVIDVGYVTTPDARASDEPAITPLATMLALELRAIRLQEDAFGLRDYQARLLDNANALILGLDRGWRITACNRALLDLLVARREDVIGRDLRDLLPTEQRAPLTAAFAAAVAGQHQAAVTVMLSTPKGPVRTVWSIAPVGRAGQGEAAVEALVAIGQDQSQIDALQQQVIRSERLATLGELAAGVVHELNNPLTSITVYADYLVRKLEAAHAEAADVDKLRRIGASAQRILRFSRDLVQYARPSRKEHEPVDLVAVVRQSISICEHLMERGGIELIVDLDPSLPVIHAVGGQLEQVLINLITNSIHAIDGGGKVLVKATPEGPSHVVIEVSDSGPGVPAADRQKIFEPFFTTKRDGKGTGLGLAIVRGIVEQHHGAIAVGQGVFGGAAFRVTLPIGERAST